MTASNAGEARSSTSEPSQAPATPSTATLAVSRTAFDDRSHPAARSVWALWRGGTDWFHTASPHLLRDAHKVFVPGEGV